MKLNAVCLVAIHVILGGRLLAAGPGPNDIITTVAGNGIEGFGGDGGVATAAQLNDPYDVGVDPEGNLFIADRGNHRIRRVDAATGIISTVVGTGVAGSSGDGGLATSAQLIYPNDIEPDQAGNLYIADFGAHRIRRVDAATGIITTVVGSGKAGFSGDGGLATSAQLHDPQDTTLDAAGNLFIADEANHRIRRVDAVTGIITTVAGTGIAGFSGDGGPATAAQLWTPRGVTSDAAGNLFISCWDNHRVRRVDHVTGIITTIVGTGTPGFSGDGGLATAAQLRNPADVALDSAGNLFISDVSNARIRKVVAQSGMILTVTGNGTNGYSGDGGPAGDAAVSLLPYSVVVKEIAANGGRSDQLFIADTWNYRIRRVAGTAAPVPTLSNWGLIVLVLLLLTAGSLILRQRGVPV